MSAYFTIQCWGCNKCITRPYTNHEDLEKQTELLKVAGWRRREFGPNASPWFCSEDCAYNSYNAKRAEEWWAQKEFHEYCQKSADGAGKVLFVIILIAIAVLFGVCSYARL